MVTLRILMESGHDKKGSRCSKEQVGGPGVKTKRVGYGAGIVAEATMVVDRY